MFSLLTLSCYLLIVFETSFRFALLPSQPLFSFSCRLHSSFSLYPAASAAAFLFPLPPSQPLFSLPCRLRSRFSLSPATSAAAFLFPLLPSQPLFSLPCGIRGFSSLSPYHIHRLRIFFLPLSVSCSHGKKVLILLIDWFGLYRIPESSHSSIALQTIRLFQCVYHGIVLCRSVSCGVVCVSQQNQTGLLPDILLLPCAGSSACVKLSDQNAIRGFISTAAIISGLQLFQ